MSTPSLEDEKKAPKAAFWLYRSPLAKTAATAALLSLIPQIYGTSTVGFFSRHVRKIAILLAVLSPEMAGDLVMKLLGAIEGANAELKLPPKHPFRKFIKDTKSYLEADTNFPHQKGVVGISALAVGEYVVQVAASLTVRQLGRLLDTAQALAKKLDGRLPFGRAEAFIALVALLFVGYGLRRRKAGDGVAEPESSDGSLMESATVGGASEDGED